MYLQPFERGGLMCHVRHLPLGAQQIMVQAEGGAAPRPTVGEISRNPKFKLILCSGKNSKSK